MNNAFKIWAFITGFSTTYGAYREIKSPTSFDQLRLFNRDLTIKPKDSPKQIMIKKLTFGASHGFFTGLTAPGMWFVVLTTGKMRLNADNENGWFRVSKYSTIQDPDGPKY